MTDNVFAEQQRAKFLNRIDEVCDSLPDFVGDYIATILNRGDFKFRTAYVYAVDLRTFFLYFVENKRMSMSDITPAYLDSLLPRDIDRFMTYLQHYTTEDDVRYNESIRSVNLELQAQIDRTSDKDTIESLRAKMKTEAFHHVGASSRAQHLAAIRGLYKFLIRNGLAHTNPASMVDTPRPASKEVIALNAKEVGDLMDKLEHVDLNKKDLTYAKRQQLRDIAIVTLLLNTGIRVSEAAGIDISDIDWNGNSVKILRKEGRFDRVYFHNGVHEALKEYIELERKDPIGDVDALFVSRWGKRMSPQAISTIVSKYTEGITVKKAHLSAHKLRASFATALYDASEDIMMVRDALNHTSLSSVTKYVDSAEKNKKAAAEMRIWKE